MMGKFSKDLDSLLLLLLMLPLNADERRHFSCSNWIGSGETFKKIRQDHSINKISPEVDD